MATGRDSPGEMPEQQDAWVLRERHDALLCGVFDGMSAWGAARPAVDFAAASAAAAFERGEGADGIAESLAAAHPEIARLSELDRDDPARPMWARKREIYGIGTTASVVFFLAGKAHIAHVGDSRIMRWRVGQGLESLTTDHTLVNDYREKMVQGEMPWDEALLACTPAVVTHVLGDKGVSSNIDRRVVGTQMTDVFLLATVGAYIGVPERAVGELLARTAAAGEGATAEALISLARAHGSRGNAAAVVHLVTG